MCVNVCSHEQLHQGLRSHRFEKNSRLPGLQQTFSECPTLRILTGCRTFYTPVIRPIMSSKFKHFFMSSKLTVFDRNLKKKPQTEGHLKAI